MTTKLEQLTKEQNLLIARIAEINQAQTELRAAMVADPLNNAGALSGQFAQNQVQLEVFNEKLSEVRKMRSAEEARLNSPEVKRDIKQAEKLIAENESLGQDIQARLVVMMREIDAAVIRSQHAAALLQSSGRENHAALNDVFNDFLLIRRTWDGRQQQHAVMEAFTASVKNR